MKILTLLLLYFFTLSPLRAFAAVTYDTSSSNVCAATCSGTIVVSHTLGSCTNSIIIVGTHWDNSVSLTSVASTGTGGGSVASRGSTTDGGGDHDSNLSSRIGVSGAQTVTATFSGTPFEAGMTVSSYCGVDQTTPHGTVEINSSNDTPVTIDVNGATNDWIVDTVFSHNALTVGAGQTQHINAATGQGAHVVATSHEVWVSDPTTMSWTQAAGDYWASVAIPLKAAAGGAPAVAHRRAIIVQ